jgi:GNAT superfamily N-acetyltransferase
MMALPEGVRVRGTRARIRISPLLREDDWAGWLRAVQRRRHDDMPWLRELAHVWPAYMRRKVPPVRYLVAVEGGEPAGWFSTFVVGRLAMLEDLFVVPEARGRGLATALVAACVRAVRVTGARIAFLSARAADTPRHMYAAMGFQPVGWMRNWRAREERRG